MSTFAEAAVAGHWPDDVPANSSCASVRRLYRRRVAAPAVSQPVSQPLSQAASPVPNEAADEAVCVLYRTQYQQLVRLAAFIVGDPGTAEEVVQDAFVAMHAAWRRLRDTDNAVFYLRRSVINRSRSVLRHRAVVDKHAPKPAPDAPSAEHEALNLFERLDVVAALRTLSARQREALVLRYYADLSEAQIASAMGISKGAVKSHASLGRSALRAYLANADSGASPPRPRRRSAGSTP
jgi:RNA polymerase sigma-70 factor (sigma-E family)